MGAGGGYPAKTAHDIIESGTEELKGKFYVICGLPNINLLVDVLGAEGRTSLMLGKHPVAKLHSQALVYHFRNKQSKSPFS